MNTNRNNNRRRGRGNNNRGPGGGNQGNRIDSRARGNAPQLLEKYRKLAQDASMNDDRVQTEYYLQFADHYFRVLADSRSPKDEARARRDFDREQGDDEDQDEDLEEMAQDRFSREREMAQERPSRERDTTQERPLREREAAQERPSRERETVQERPSRERPPRDQRSRNIEEAPAEEGPRAVEGDGEASEAANPFVRDTRARRPRTRARAKPAGEQAEGEAGDAGDAGVDPAVLPPSIARSEPEAAEEQPARPRATRGRPRRARPADNGDAETLEAVS